MKNRKELAEYIKRWILLFVGPDKKYHYDQNKYYSYGHDLNAYHYRNFERDTFEFFHTVGPLIFKYWKGDIKSLIDINKMTKI